MWWSDLWRATCGQWAVMSPCTVQTVAKIKCSIFKKKEKHDSDNYETNNAHNFLHFARHCAHTARRIRQGSNRVGRNKLRLLNTEPPLLYAHAVFKQKPQWFAFLCMLCSIQNNYLKATVCVPERYVKVILKCTLVQALRLCTGRRFHRWSWDIAVLYRHWGTVQTAVPIGGVEKQKPQWFTFLCMLCSI